MDEILLNSYKNQAQIIWNEFANNIKYDNRYFVSNEILNKIDNIIKYSSISPFGDFLVYRARVGDFLNDGDETMKSPPKEKVSDGRCNPRGISYFYTATDIETAIAEVRPFKSSKVTVATFKIINDFHVIDFKAISIWEKGMNTDLPLSLEDRCFLDIILEALSKPVLQENNLEYIPLQYITEYIKKKGYNGVRYKSTVSNGYNILFFNDNNFELIEKKLFEITEAKYLFNDISGDISLNK